MTLATDIRFTEFVEIDLNFSHSSFRDLEIELVSPSGQVSTLVGPYESEDPIPLFGEFRFGSAKHLGEDPNGRWTHPGHRPDSRPDRDLRVVEHQGLWTPARSRGSNREHGNARN